MRRRTLYEAKVEIAKAYEAQEEARKVMAAAHEPFSGPGHKEWEGTSPEYVQARREWGYREHDRKKLMESFAADPELRKHMTCARIRFEGPSEPRWVTEDREPTKVEIETSMWGGDDHVSKHIHAWADGKDLRSSGSGSGCGGWDIEYSGSYEEVAKLCDEAAEKFRPYLDCGMLVIRLCLGEWHFKDFGHAEMQKALVS
jgi:hypothetical protein